MEDWSIKLYEELNKISIGVATNTANIERASSSIHRIEKSFDAHLEKEEIWQNTMTNKVRPCPEKEIIKTIQQHNIKQNGSIQRIEAKVNTLITTEDVVRDIKKHIWSITFKVLMIVIPLMGVAVAYLAYLKTHTLPGG